jgi:uncharacterized membrane protein
MEFQFFTVIHEFAVLGTTFFMLALATLWYSPLMFGTVWARVSKTTGVVFDESSANFVRQLSVTFVAYLIEVALLAWLIAYVPRIGLTHVELAAVLMLFTVVVTLPPIVFEERPFLYYAIHTGFMVVFIGISVAALAYWPW